MIPIDLATKQEETFDSGQMSNNNPAQPSNNLANEQTNNASVQMTGSLEYEPQGSDSQQPSSDLATGAGKDYDDDLSNYFTKGERSDSQQEKFYDPEDSTLTFVDAIDDMDCKYSKIHFIKSVFKASNTGIFCVYSFL